MLVHDVSLSNLHVVFAVDRAGIVGRDGETHQGLFDASLLSTVPGMTILCPSNYAELDAMLHRAVYEFNGPVAIRYPRGSEGEYRDLSSTDDAVILEGSDVTLVTYGSFVNNALESAEILKESGVSAEVIKLGLIKPSIFCSVLDSVKKTGRLAVLEDACEAGCVGNRILSACALSGITVKKAVLLNWGEGIIPHASQDELIKQYGLDGEGISRAVLDLFKGDRYE